VRRVPPVSIVTDTTAYLPADVTEANRITVVSLYINWGGERTEREADITDIGAFMEELRTGEQLPTTSQPSVGDFVGAYEPLLADGGEVVSIHISGGVSGTVEAARQAAEALERDGTGGERVHVMDSATAAGGLGIVVLAAARSANHASDAQQVLADAQAARDALKMWFAIDTLDFLKRSGRIGGAAAWIGSTLKIKPILTLEYEMTPIERVRTSRRAFERMVDYARQRKESGADGWVVQHIQAEEQAQRLIDACREMFGNDAVFVSEIGPVLAAHTGPGLLGVGGVPRAMMVDD
jgi:DegV family protein with EDD domain